jgi:hypothetical protein
MWAFLFPENNWCLARPVGAARSGLQQSPLGIDLAPQMGHKNANMVFNVYAKWIDGTDRGREKAKPEAALRNEKAAKKRRLNLTWNF